MVEDDAGRSADRALAAEHGARYVALGAPRGPQRRPQRRRSTPRAGDLLCFLDDDVAVWPGWLGRAARRPPARTPTHEVFGGPIRARLEGTDLHACGREPPPVTTLDLGPRGPRRRRSSGARTWRSAASALERAGGVRPRPLRAAATRRSGSGGCARPAGGSATSPPRASTTAAPGADARLARPRARRLAPRAASRAATTRPRAPRRRSRGELRTLAGCVWHIARLPLRQRHRAERAQRRPDPRGARAAGRRRRAAPDYLSGSSGTLGRRALLAAARARPRRRPPHAAAAGAAVAPRRARPRRRAGCSWPASMRPEPSAVAARGGGASCGARATTSRSTSTRRAPGAGKWANLAPRSPPTRRRASTGCCSSTTTSCCPRGFLDAFLLVAERHGLQLAQPAHALRQHAAWPVTRRRPGSARAAHALRRDRPGHRAPRATRSAPCCRSPTCDGLGAGRRTGRRVAARARLAARRRRRHARSGTCARRRGLPARGREQEAAAFLGPALRDPRRGRRDARHADAL